MKLLIKLFILSVFLYYGYCESEKITLFAFEETTSGYLLPDGGEIKSLSVEIVNKELQATVLTITCYNYDSLKYFIAKQEFLQLFKYYFGIIIKFENCFNAETNPINYNNTVYSILAALPRFEVNSDPIEGLFEISLDSSSTVNCDVLFNNVDLKFIERTSLINVTCTTSKFLNDLQCEQCNFVSNIQIDFNEFREPMNTTSLEIQWNKILNLNKDNLKKFRFLTDFIITGFSLDDYNIFNVPALFEYNTELTNLYIGKSQQQITLHEEVFKGLTKLRNLELYELQVDYIPANLFKELISLETLNLKQNNIKTLHSNTFEYTRALTTVDLVYNPIFMEPHDEIQPFIIGTNNLELNLENITVHTIDAIDVLVRNPNITILRFRSSTVDPINIAKLTRLRHNNRETSVKIEIEAIAVGIKMDFDYVKSNAIPIKSSSGMKQKFNVKISIPIQGPVCNECWMLKNFFYQYVMDSFDQLYHEDLGIFFETSGLVFIPIISCPDSDLFFEEKYEKNCPQNCDCRYNPLLKKIKIDCSNKNLTEIPVIPYPEQYNKIAKLDLIFENNSLSVLTYDYQDESIYELDSSLLLRNNKIESMALGNRTNNIDVLDLCENLLLKEGSTIKFISSSDQFEFSEANCKYNSVLVTDPRSYIRYAYFESELEEQFLNQLQCN